MYVSQVERENNVLYILMRENSEEEATEEVCVAAIGRCMYRRWKERVMC